MHTDNTNLYDLSDNRVVNYPNFDPQLTLYFTSLDTLPLRDVVLETPILIDEGFSYDLLDHDTGPSSMNLSGIMADEQSSTIEFAFILDLSPGMYVIHFTPFLRFVSRDIEFPGRCEGGNVEVTILLPTEKIINYDILTDDHIAVDSVFIEDGTGTRVITSSYYFEVVE